ncbi:MAG: winged helix DNA-binding protein [Dehalococcoidia bacterium]
MMTDLPSLVKILRYLRNSRSGKTHADIIRAVRETQEHVARALEKLVKDGVITEHGDLYQYQPTPKGEEICRKMFIIYDEVVRREQL